MRRATRMIGALACALCLLLTSVPAAASAPEAEAPAPAEFRFDPDSPGDFVIRIADVPGEYAAVKARVWTLADRGDLLEYDCATSSEGELTASGSSADFGFRQGVYQAEIAGVAGDGSEDVLADVSASLYYNVGTLYLPEVGASPFYSFQLLQPELPEGCPVWFKVCSQISEGARAFVYPGQPDEGGDYRCTVALPAHGDGGTYVVAAFCGAQEDPVYLTSGNFEVPGVDAGSSLAAEADGSHGTMRVRVEVQSAVPVREVSLAAWSQPDQSNLCWYPMEADGTGYAVTVDISRHGDLFGEYTLHAYARLANGVQALAAGATARLDASNFVAAVRSGPGAYTIRVLGPSSQRLAAAVWSEDGGQDDLIWYSPAKSSADCVEFALAPYAHKSAGAYVAHVYAGDQLVGAASFEVSGEDLLKPTERRIAQHCQNVYSQVGADLEAVYLWTVRTLKYVPKDWSSSRFPAGLTREEAFALEGFERHAGDCHTYSSTFAYLARGLGYDAEYVLGYVWSVRKVWATHSFVIVHMPDGDYICDPELQSVSKTGKNLYMQPASRSKAKYKW